MLDALEVYEKIKPQLDKGDKKRVNVQNRSKFIKKLLIVIVVVSFIGGFFHEAFWGIGLMLFILILTFWQIGLGNQKKKYPNRYLMM